MVMNSLLSSCLVARFTSSLALVFTQNNLFFFTLSTLHACSFLPLSLGPTGLLALPWEPYIALKRVLTTSSLFHLSVQLTISTSSKVVRSRFDTFTFASPNLHLQKLPYLFEPSNITLLRVALDNFAKQIYLIPESP
jgi:hypothetical protein